MIDFPHRVAPRARVALLTPEAFGFGAQHRAQAHGTYKLPFNTLLGRP